MTQTNGARYCCVCSAELYVSAQPPFTGTRNDWPLQLASDIHTESIGDQEAQPHVV